MSPVPSDRERRLALNEAAFRVANERIRNWPERRGHEGPARYYCECARTSCHEQVLMRSSEYERVRGDSHLFVVVPGHQMLDLERVVERTDHYFVIEKNPGVHGIVETTDPRHDE